jgi:hypothetical protein
MKILNNMSNDKPRNLWKYVDMNQYQVLNAIIIYFEQYDL